MRPRLHRMLIVFAAAAVALAACSAGASPSTAAISVGDAWARPAAASAQSAAYMTIKNTSGSTDALLSATSPAAGMVELHETSTDGAGMTGMHPVARLDIPAGSSVQLKPGGYHFMLMSLTGDLVAGKTIELDLVFEHAGKVVVMAEIRQG
jgi:copper(I)-binding protein